MKTTILAIVGQSGVGKTYMSLKLKEFFGIPHIVSSTTRPPREGEVDGIDHFFRGPKEVPDESQRLAYTKYGGYEYWAEHPEEGTKIISYVIDEKGLKELIEKYSDRYNIVSILIKRPNREDISEDRKQRDLQRESLSDEWYKLVIENTSDLKTFDTQIKYIYDILSNYYT